MGQQNQLKNPDARIIVGTQTDMPLLKTYANCLQGIATGDFPRFGRKYWELSAIDNVNWIFQQTTFEANEDFVGKENVIFWENGEGTISKSDSARVQGLEAMEKVGIAVAMMSEIKCTINQKTIFDNNTAIIIPENPDNISAIWCFCSSPQFNEEVRKIDQALKVTNATLVKVPFDLDHWQKVAAEKYPNGLPKPYSDDPIQWLFHGHPMPANNPLQVALARLAGYRWPAETDEEMELSSEARRQIDEIKDFDALTDADGIICIPALAGEESLATRLRDYMKAVWGPAWNDQTLTKALATEGTKGSDLETWLRDEAFVQHCKVFGNRPFLWHIWDGRKDGFSAFVNYHKLDAATLQKLIYTYLGDYLRQCEAAKERGDSGAEGKLLAARDLKANLEAILEGEVPHDIYVRWKPLEQQAIGWHPDLNDGVRLNIRPFMEANVLRKKPNIKWGVDRGKNADGSVRDNDRYLTLAEK